LRARKRNYLKKWLANEIGVDQHKISEIENDKVSPRWSTIEKITEKLDTPILDLLPKSSLNVFNNNFTENSVQNNQCSVYGNHDAIQQIITTVEHLKKEINALKKG